MSRGGVRGLPRRAARRREDLVQGVGGLHALFRRLPAHRGDGRARPRDAALRADEAGRPDEPARARRAPLCGGAAAPGQCAGHAVEHGRLPDQAQARRAGAHLPHDPGPRQRRVRAPRRPAPQHLPQFAEAARRRAAPARPSRGCASPARSPAARATSRAPPSACWPGRAAAAERLGAAWAAAAADHGLRRAARPHHRRPPLRLRRASGARGPSSR